MRKLICLTGLRYQDCEPILKDVAAILGGQGCRIRINPTCITGAPELSLTEVYGKNGLVRVGVITFADSNKSVDSCLACFSHPSNGADVIVAHCGIGKADSARRIEAWSSFMKTPVEYIEVKGLSTQQGIVAHVVNCALS